VAPFEGRHRDLGYDVIYSARLAIQETNELRLPGQAWLALVALDDFGDPTMARQSAEAMAVDPDVVAVIGHWLPETTLAANSVYVDEGLPLIVGGQAPFGPSDPAALDETFLRDYAEITPFDEVAGPYAGSAYKGLQLVISAIREAEASGRAIDRSTIGDILDAGSIDGLSGSNSSPERRGE
jgi:ABC-type branched-subunit amino acid transport system substrate-binding protein